MILQASDFTNRVTFMTGSDKACGKTTILKYSLGLVRSSGQVPAFLGIGVDGGAKAASGGKGGARLFCQPGEVFVTAEPFLHQRACQPEILAVLPGSTALGRLAIVRAHRAAEVVLVGPEHNQAAVEAIEQILAEGWAQTCLVDGAIHRLTQVAPLAGAQFAFCLRVTGAELDRSVRTLVRLAQLVELPVWSAASAAASPDTLVELEGPLTPQTVAQLSPAIRQVVISDLTKVFLDASAWSAFQRHWSLAVRKRLACLGFVILLRDVTRAAFCARLQAIAPDWDAAKQQRWLAWNPYQEAGHA